MYFQKKKKYKFWFDTLLFLYSLFGENHVNDMAISK